MIKKTIFSTALLFFTLALASISAHAQLTYEYSDISYDDTTGTVEGYSATEIDYWSAYYYQAYVESYLYNDSTAQLMDYGYDQEPDIAEVDTYASADSSS